MLIRLLTLYYTARRCGDVHVWRLVATSILEQTMKAVSDKKKQKHLAGHSRSAPVDVSVRPETKTEDYQFAPAAVGQVDQGTLYLPSANSFPYDD